MSVEKGWVVGPPRTRRGARVAVLVSGIRWPEGPPRHGSTPRVALLDEQRKPCFPWRIFFFCFSGAFFFAWGLGPAARLRGFC